jgi:type 1 glutamine amidotransferase
MHFRKLVPRFLSAKYILSIVAVGIFAVLLGHFATLGFGKTKPPLQVLIMGGGTSHNFTQSYQQLDAQALRRAGDVVRYIDSWAQLSSELNKTNVLIQASNQMPPPDPSVRNRIMTFVNTGGGLLVVHAGVWYNWEAWPAYNRILIGGGTRSHDKLGDFEVTVTHPEHPIMKGVPVRFMIHDELYHQEIDPSGSPVEVLAVTTSPLTGKTYPSIWVVKAGRGKIACIALGHDQDSHQNPAYLHLLTNATNWLGSKVDR